MPNLSARGKTCGLAGLTAALVVLPVIVLSMSFPVQANEAEDSIKSIQKEALTKQLDGDVDGAIDLYETACNMAKNEFGENSKIVGDLYLNMGILALDSAKQFDRAENYLSRAAKLNDNSVTAHLKLAELLSLRGTSEKNLQARHEIEKALTKNPRSEPARQALAMFYQQQGQPMRAFQQYSFLNQVMTGRTIPRDKFSHAKAAPPPKAEPIIQPVYRPPTPPVSYVRTQPVPKPVVKLRPKPIVVPKPKPKPRPIVQPQMRELQPIAEPKPQRTKPVKSRNGLVPPPPPVMPMFGGGFAPPPPQPGVGSPAFNIRTEAKLKKSKAAESADEKPAEKPAEKPRATPSDSPDFLLDWASERKKK